MMIFVCPASALRISISQNSPINQSPCLKESLLNFVYLYHFYSIASQIRPPQYDLTKGEGRHMMINDLITM